MARKGKTGVLKRLREVKKAEKAALKRDQMKSRRESASGDEEPAVKVATVDDMAGYGFPSRRDDDDSR